MEFHNESRGMQNNNPGNIRHGNNWRGEIIGTDRSFEKFKSVEWGIRAIYLLLAAYRNKHGMKTVREIISRFAPPIENNTKNYIVGVLGYMSRLNDKARLACEEHGENLNVLNEGLDDEMVAAIIYFENGFNPFNLEFISKCKNL